MNNKADILLKASQLRPGDTVRGVCPRCEGGSSGELSLSITLSEEGHVLWQCFRAKCIEKGTTLPKNTTDSMLRKEHKRKVFGGAVEPLKPEHLETIAELWGIHEPPFWWWTSEYGGRVAMSIRSPKYVHRGWSLRDIHGVSRIKALTYIDEGEEGISWYKTSPFAPTVLVEDIPSSVRASQYMNAVALLGTGIGLARAQEISDFAPRPIIIALDQDATTLSFRWANKWALLWGDVKVLPLKKDMKDMKENELKDLLT